MFEGNVWQDEKDFIFDVPVNLQNARVYGKGTCLRPQIRFQEKLWFPPLHHIDQIWYKIFLKKNLKRRFVQCVERPPSSPDVNPLDYFFWDLIKTMVY